MKYDRKVFTNRELSDGAKVLYGYILGLRRGDQFSDTYILKAMGISQQSLTRRKAELKKAGLITVEQLSSRLFIMFVGHSKKPADVVRKEWLDEQDN